MPTRADSFYLFILAANLSFVNTLEVSSGNWSALRTNRSKRQAQQVKQSLSIFNYEVTLRSMLFA